MNKSAAVVIESIEVRELLSFLFYLDIFNKLSLLQRKHLKYMYAKCLNFPCFITYLVACIHVFCMFYLYVSLGYSCYSQLLPKNAVNERRSSAVIFHAGGWSGMAHKLNCSEFQENYKLTKVRKV